LCHPDFSGPAERALEVHAAQLVPACICQPFERARASKFTRLRVPIGVSPEVVQVSLT